MKSYGKFEAVREVCLTPFAAIWAARPVGTQGQAVACIKLMQPEAPIFAGKGAAAAEEMLVAAALQQSIANKSEHWAPIYELGYDGNSAFYVTKLFDRSLAKMVESKTKVSSMDLLTICSAIIEGLMDLRSAFGRSHGNLNPSNVLIGGKGRIRREDVRLTDPHAGDQEMPSITRSPDVKALGEIIYALVTGRPHSSARWPVPESVEWARLGSSGPQWLDLCNDLLNTMARQGPMSLPKIQARLSAMRVSRRRTPRSWFAVAALVALAACGFVFRDKVSKLVGSTRQWAQTGAPRTVTSRAVMPTTEPSPLPPRTPETIVQTIALKPPVQPVDPPIAAVTPPLTVAPPVTPPITPPMTPAVVSPAVPPLTHTEPPVVPQPVSAAAATPPPVSQPLPVVQLPKFLSGTAAAKFLEIVSRLSTPATVDQLNKFVAAVNPLDTEYRAPAIHTDRPWQKELANFADGKRQAELTIAVAAVGDSQTPDPSKYNKFREAVEAFGSEASDAEDVIDSGNAWASLANRETIQRSLLDEPSLLDEAKLRAAAAPPVLEEMRTISDAVAASNAKALIGVIHDQNTSLPARVTAWQALDLPAMHGQWLANSSEFIAGQKDGDALIAAAAGSSLNTKTAISDYQDRRLQTFYTTLTTEPALVDAITHLTAIEGDRRNQRPKWLEYDRLVYSLKLTPLAPTDSDLRQLKALTTVPAAMDLSEALVKAKNAATSENPLKTVGPGILDWATRPYNSSGLQGCLYTYENCPPIEFIRVDPGPGKGMPFYLATTDVPVGLVSAVLADPTQSAPAATESLQTLNLNSQPPTPGAHLWKFAASKGIDLDPAGYLKYFRQAPAADLPIQQITPQSALFIARDLGCRLPSSAEWHAALAMASDPPPGNDEMKGFAVAGWKLRDADFTALVEKASLNQHYPDDGIFLGADAQQIPTGTAAAAWLPSAVRKMGGWTVADLRNDREGQREMARLDENSSDFRTDLVEPAQMGFRPVGSTHHVFHDLVGNVAEYVLDTPLNDVESLPAGTTISAKHITDWFSSGKHLEQVGVIGGSFLSPPNLDPMTRLPLPANAPDTRYADVGFRLAFTDPKAYADVSMVIQGAVYLYAPPAEKPVDTAP